MVESLSTKGGTGTLSKSAGFEQFKVPDKVSTRPTLKDLQRWITPQYAPCWREIGIQLDLTNETLSIIREDNPHSITKRCNAMLSKWLEVDDTSASWQKLFTVIDNCTYQTLNDNSNQDDDTGNSQEQCNANKEMVTSLKCCRQNSHDDLAERILRTNRTIVCKETSFQLAYCQLLASELLIFLVFSCSLVLYHTESNTTPIVSPLAFGTRAPISTVHISPPVMKTPISKLQEYCQQNKLTVTPPHYNEFQVSEGFRFAVTVRGKQYSGETKRKKQEAKHSAAETALQQLYTSTISVSFVKELKEKYFDKNKIVFKKDDYFKTIAVDGGYQCTIHIDESVFTSSKCQSKSEAENQAAEQALRHFKL